MMVLLEGRAKEFCVCQELSVQMSILSVMYEYC